MAAGLPRFLPEQTEREFELRRTAREATQHREETREAYHELWVYVRFLEARLAEYLEKNRPEGVERA